MKYVKEDKDGHHHIALAPDEWQTFQAFAALTGGTRSGERPCYLGAFLTMRWMNQLLLDAQRTALADYRQTKK